MAKAIQINQLADEITNAMKEYNEDVAAAIEITLDDTAKAILMDAAGNAPHQTGKYARGFTVTKDGERERSKRIIWNKKDYRRVHLLEFGHALWQGGRARAFPHLRPAYDKHGAPLPDHIKRILGRGG
jgi:hypothetical protein